jgi:phage terminase large subunit
MYKTLNEFIKNPPPLFLWNYEAPERILINQGGTSSGKTYNILLVLIFKLIEQPNQICTVVGRDVPTLKKGALTDMKTILREYSFLEPYVLTFNKSERIFHFFNGSEMQFYSFKDRQDAKAGKRDFLFINEADGVGYGIYKELQTRTKKKTYIDYNPSTVFWVHNHLLAADNVKRIISNYKHNPYLSPQQIENIYATNKDPVDFDVYVKGKTGRTKEVIYTFDIVSDFPHGSKLVGYGLDFGFTNSYTTLVKCGLYDNKLYFKEIIYERGLYASTLKDLFIKNKVSRTVPIFADSASPAMISELNSLGFKNVKAVKKRKIEFGIALLKSYGALQLVKGSINLIDEVSRYKYKRDSKTGIITNDVIRKDDHALDALRYWADMTLPRMNRKPKRKRNSSDF